MKVWPTLVTPVVLPESQSSQTWLICGLFVQGKEQQARSTWEAKARWSADLELCLDHSIPLSLSIWVTVSTLLDSLGL